MMILIIPGFECLLLACFQSCLVAAAGEVSSASDSSRLSLLCRFLLPTALVSEVEATSSQKTSSSELFLPADDARFVPLSLLPVVC